MQTRIADSLKEKAIATNYLCSHMEVVNVKCLGIGGQTGGNKMTSKNGRSWW